MDINAIPTLRGVSSLNSTVEGITKQGNIIQNQNENGGESFKDMLSKFVGDVNQLQVKADNSVNKLAAGEITDIHDVMVKVEEANLSFSLMMEIRNKIVEGYKEIMRTGV